MIGDVDERLRAFLAELDGLVNRSVIVRVVRIVEVVNCVSRAGDVEALVSLPATARR